MAILSVSQLNRYANYYLRDNKNLSGVYVKGEITNLKKYYSSGHYYFVLKDETSSIRACMFSSYVSKLQFDINDGMSVVTIGNVGIYERDGAFQLYVTDVYASGAGEEYLKYLKLKENLEKKGYFLSENKKDIPSFPKKIAVVTSSEGAAIHDIINIMSRRNPICIIDVYNTSVQGYKSEMNICSMLKLADNGNADTVILARGGGSSEDLSVFNSEKICDIIHAMKTPVIAAIGHETDYTLSDYTADLRAPTPSAAAELCSISLQNILDICIRYDNRISLILKNKVGKIENIFDEKDKRFRLAYKNNKYSKLLSKTISFENRINDCINKKIFSIENKYSILNQKLESNNISSIMEKGFCLVYKDGKIILPIDNIEKDNILEIVSLNKKITVKVVETEDL